MEKKMSCRSRVGILMTAVTAMGVVTAAASASTPPPVGYVDASTFGGGYNATDATAALQAAINSGNSQIFVPNKGTPWIVTPLSLTKSNQTILFESGTVVQAKSGSFLGTNEGLFEIVGQSNVTLSGYGATFRMNQSDYTQPPYPAGEWRAGIEAYSVSNFQVKGLTIENTGGDGIYLGTYPNPALTNSNVVIKDVTLKNNYRNGISVISANGLTVDNATVLSTNGTAPKAGIDFEPDNVSQTLQNITVKNSIFASNGGNGIMFDLAKWDSGGTNQSPYNKQPSDVTATIENVTVYANAADGINLRESLKNVTFKDSIIVGNSGYGTAAWKYANNSDNSIDYSLVGGNGLGSFDYPTKQGVGSLTSVPSPLFYSTDPNSPGFMYLDPAVAASILHGASDGGYMGARPVYVVPEPAGMALLLTGGLIMMGRRRSCLA
jgi:hypothetical protein